MTDELSSQARPMQAESDEELRLASGAASSTERPNSPTMRADSLGEIGEHVVLQIRLRRLRERLWLGLAAIGWLVSLSLGGLLWLAWEDNESYYDTTGGVYETFHSGNPKAESRIAIISVRGVIVEGTSVVDQIERIREQGAVEAIVLRVESPGGTVYGSDYIYHHLCKLRDELEVPIVVSMGSIAASGGYYVSMVVGDAPGRIFAEPTTITGSIGVILPHYDVTGLMERYDIRDDSITSHDNKGMLSMTHRMSDEQRQVVQSQIDESFERFKSIVVAGRPEMREPNASLGSSRPIPLRSLADGRDVATGEVFTAEQALQHGLVDRIGYIEDAIEHAAKLADLEADSYRVVRFVHPQPLIDLPDFLSQSDESILATLFTSGSYARAWYISGQAPPLLPAPYEAESRSHSADLR